MFCAAGKFRLERCIVEKPLKSAMDILALLPIEYLAAQPDPFEQMSDKDNRLDENYRDVVISGIQGYQIFTYFQLLKQYLDESSAEDIQRVLLAGLQGSVAGSNRLNQVLTLIDTAHAIGPVNIEGLKDNDEFPVEFSMALTLLLSLAESPHYAPDAEQREAEIQRMDINLDRKFSHYLKQARQVFSEKFAPILSHMFLENTPTIN